MIELNAGQFAMILFVMMGGTMGAVLLGWFIAKGQNKL